MAKLKSNSDLSIIPGITERRNWHQRRYPISINDDVYLLSGVKFCYRCNHK